MSHSVYSSLAMRNQDWRIQADALFQTSTGWKRALAISHHLTLLREESQLLVVAEKPVLCSLI